MNNIEGKVVKSLTVTSQNPDKKDSYKALFIEFTDGTSLHAFCINPEQYMVVALYEPVLSPYRPS